MRSGDAPGKVGDGGIGPARTMTDAREHARKREQTDLLGFGRLLEVTDPANPVD
jgi:hypothetical protein